MDSRWAQDQGHAGFFTTKKVSVLALGVFDKGLTLYDS